MSQGPMITLGRMFDDRFNRLNTRLTKLTRQVKEDTLSVAYRNEVDKRLDALENPPKKEYTRNMRPVDGHSPVYPKRCRECRRDRLWYTFAREAFCPECDVEGGEIVSVEML